MANNYAQGSVAYDVSPEQEDFLTRAMDLLVAMGTADSDMIEDPKDEDLKNLDAEDKEFADLCSKRLEGMGIDLSTFDDCIEGYGAPGFTMEIDDTDDGRAVYFYGDEWLNADQVCALLQAMLAATDDDRILTGEIAFTCSKPRPGEFGGAAFAVSRHGQRWENTQDLAEKLAELLRNEAKGK